MNAKVKKKQVLFHILWHNLKKQARAKPEEDATPSAACCRLLMATVYCLLSTVYCLLCTAYCLQPTACWLLLMSTDYCLVSTAYCLLPTAYCLLPTVYCLLSFLLFLYSTIYLFSFSCILPFPFSTAYCLLHFLLFLFSTFHLFNEPKQSSHNTAKIFPSQRLFYVSFHQEFSLVHWACKSETKISSSL